MLGYAHSEGMVLAMTKADQLAAGLDDFLAVSPDVEAAAVVSADGLPMASALPPYVEEDRLAAMSAALLTLGERAASGLGKGELEQVFVEADQGYVVLMAAGKAVLVAVTSAEAKVGLVLFEMRKASTRVAEIMNSDGPQHTSEAASSNGAMSGETHEPPPPMVDDAPPAPYEPAEPPPPVESAYNTWH
jgi:predicted regulator of Ras-like GTPase activity (Roadblock/LC7/MglB family)